MRRLVPLGLIILLVGLATSIVSPFVSLFLSTEVHAAPASIGIYLFLSPLAIVLAATAVGRFSDRRPIRRTLVIVAALAGFAGFGLTSVARDYVILLILALTLVPIAETVLPQSYAYAREVLTGSPRAALATSGLRTLFSIAWVAGPPMAAALLAAGGFRWVYGVAAGMLALTALTAVVWLRPIRPARSDTGTPAEPATPAEPGAPPVAAAIGRLPSNVLAAVTGLVLVQCAGVLGVQGMSLYVTGDLHGRVADAGLILGLCAALEIPLMLVGGMLTTRIPLRRLVLGGSALGIAYYLLASMATQSWHLAAGQIINACFISAVFGIGLSYVHELLPDQPGRAATLFTNAYPIGAMLAGPVVGAAAHFGFRLVFITATALCLIGFLLLLASRPVEEKAAVQPGLG